VIDRELRVDEICWHLEPLPDPPPLSVEDRLVEVTIDALSYRLIVLEGFDQLRRLTLSIDHKDATIRELREQLRARRSEIGQ
jgi:hypothetical protein